MNRPPYLAGWRQRDIVLMIGLALVSLVIARVPGLWWLLFPFRLFDTFIHELSHGFAALITGGSFLKLVVSPEFSGMAWSRGGVQWFITSAGYLGSALFGGVLTLLSARRISGRHLLVGLGIALGILSLLFVRNIFGIAAGLSIAGALALAGRQLPMRWANGLILFLAVQSILNALDSLLDLTMISATQASAASDAQIIAQATGIPAIIWAMLWSVLAIGILLATLRVAYGQPKYASTKPHAERSQPTTY